MSPDKEEFDPVEEEHAGFVPAVIACSAEEAELYCELLNDHEIPALVGNDTLDSDDGEQCKVTHSRAMTHGVPVMVPEVLLDEASEVIADREDLEEFRAHQEDADEDDDDKLDLEEELNSDLAEPLDDEDEDEP